jgi:hypothetical protein
MGEGEAIVISDKDRGAASEFSPEFLKQKAENPLTYSLLHQIHENGEQPSFYTFLSFLDSREADLKNKKAEASTLGAVNQMRETTLNIASGRRNHITSADVEYMTSYLSDYSGFWEKNTNPETPTAQQEIANNNMHILDAFKNLLTENEIYKDAKPVYQTIQLKPDHALEVLTKPLAKSIEGESGEEKPSSTESDVEALFYAAGKDNTAMKEEAPWPDFRLAVDEARKYYERQKSTYGKQQKEGKSVIIVVTVKDGKVVGSPTLSADIIDADPANGVYLFNPQAYKTNPLSLDRAAKTADEFDKRGERVGTALRAWEKVQKGETIDDDQKLAITQILDEHEDYLTDKMEGDQKPEGLYALEKMFDFVIEKLGLEPRAKREKEIDPDDLSAATGRPPTPDMPNELMNLAAMFGQMQGGNQN